MPDEKDPNEATALAETFHRHGEPDPSKWQEAEAVTDRPNDTPLRGDDVYAVPNTTMADRRKARDVKQVKSEDVEDKAVKKKATRKK